MDDLIGRIKNYSQVDDGRKTNEGETKKDDGKKAETSSSKRKRKDDQLGYKAADISYNGVNYF